MKRRIILLLAVLAVAGCGLVAYQMGLVTKRPASSTGEGAGQEGPASLEVAASALPSSPPTANALFALAGATNNTSLASPQERPRPYVTGAVGPESKRVPLSHRSSGSNAKVLAKYDKDGDGKLSDTEKEAIRKHLQAEFEPLRKSMLTAYDANGDGVLDANEQQAGRAGELAKLEKLRTSLLPKYDINRNGVIDPGEQAEIRRAGQEFLNNVRTDLTRKYDANNNGTLDPEESATISAVAERLREQMRERLKQYDLNGDGKLEESERARLKSDLDNKKTQEQ